MLRSIKIYSDNIAKAEKLAMLKQFQLFNASKPAQNMAVEKPNPMLNAHQAWLDGLVKATIEEKSK